jgi:transposase InsO family protein
MTASGWIILPIAVTVKIQRPSVCFASPRQFRPLRYRLHRFLFSANIWALSPLILHSDNSSPMKDATLLETLYSLRIISSRSRPRVSNDIPYAEFMFRTCKYRPNSPLKDLDLGKRLGISLYVLSMGII